MGRFLGIGGDMGEQGFAEGSQAHRPGVSRRIGVRVVSVLPLLTPTLPPATHTNCYRVGRTLIDPASPWPEEQARLHAWAGPVDRILLTHHHADHVGGVEALRAATGAPVYAHRDSRLPFAVDGWLQDEEVVDTGAGHLRCLHTPGHADGHLAFRLEETGEVIGGDLVAGIGTIVLAPPEGHLATYLASLARVRPLVTTLHPAHGPPLPDGPGAIDLYLAHRHHRTDQVRAALRDGADSPASVAARVYAGLPGVDLALAAVQARAHLEWLREAGEASDLDGTWRLEGG